MSKSSSGTPKRVAAGLLAGALAIFGLAIAPSAGATNHETETERLAGANRFGTAVDVCGQLEEAHDVTTVVLASGRNFPDALAAAPLATHVDGCILLVEPDALPDETLAGLREVAPDRVIIVGGTDAVSADVEAAVRDEVPDTDRVAGVDRFCTAGEIAGEIGAANVAEAEGEGATAILATGRVAADALSAGPLAAYGEANTGDGVFPILLAEPTGDLPACTQAALEALNITNVIVVGGTAAISEATVADAEEITGDAEATRLAGTTRESTSTAVATFLLDVQGFAMERVVLATGRPPAVVGTFSPDALVAGPYAAFFQAPVLLVAGADSLGEAVETFLEERGGETILVVCVGGTTVISNATCLAAATAAEEAGPDAPVGNQTVTTRPELVSATIARTTSPTQVTPGNPQGLTVQYCFDEPVTGANPTSNDFWIYPNDSTQGLNNGTATVDSTNNRCVNVFFTGAQYDTAAKAAALTLAAVDDGAVVDGSNQGSPEGDAPLGTSGNTALAAGITAAPDLVSVGGFRSASTEDQTAVDFTFDEAAHVEDTAGFNLILTTGDQVPCIASQSTVTPSGGSVAGGSGTTTITVVCDDLQAGQTAGNVANITADQVARGFVYQGTVDDLATLNGNENPLQAADVSAAGNSLDPDLESGAFQPDSTVGVDQVLYTFDEALNTANLNATRFGIYYTNGNELYATAGNAVRSPSNDRQVLVTFPDGSLADAVGANVLDDAAQEITSAGTRFNEEDEVAVTPSTATTTTSGRTSGPDLTNVVISRVTDAFGVTRNVVTYVFDEDIDDASVTINRFHAYLSDGTAMTCNTISPAAPANRTEELDNTITCSAFTLDNGGAATDIQVGNIVLGTVDNAAVDDEAGTATSAPNPIGAEPATGGAGTPAS